MNSSTLRARSALITALGPIAAVAVALVIGGLIMLATGSDPIEAYRALIDRAFGSRRNIGETGVYSAPLILGGLAFAAAYRAGMFNIGIEGQLMLGGFAAGMVAALDLGLPKAIHIPLGLLAAVVVGGLWGLIPGVLRATRGAHEVITTIMLNYLAFRIINYVIQRGENVLPIATQSNGTERAQPSARLPIVLEGTRLHLGFVIAIVAAVVLWYIFSRTTLGYRIRTVGLSSGAARYGGISWGKTIIIAMAMSGALAGLAGAGEAMGLHGRMYGTPTGYGFTAIAVGLVGRNNPIAIIVSGILFGALSAGAPGMQSADVSKEIVSVLQGLIILAVAAFEVANRIPGVRKLLAPPSKPTGQDRASAVGTEPEVEPTRPTPAI